MKVILSVLLVFSLGVMACNGQYSSQIAEYRCYIFNTHGEVPHDYSMGIDTVKFDISWQRGNNLQGFIIPSAWEQIYLHSIENTQGLWDGDTAKTVNDEIVVSLNEGYYAVLLTEVDIYNEESGFSEPFYIFSREIYARVPIYLFKRE